MKREQFLSMGFFSAFINKSALLECFTICENGDNKSHVTDMTYFIKNVLYYPTDKFYELFDK